MTWDPESKSREAMSCHDLAFGKISMTVSATVKWYRARSILPGAATAISFARYQYIICFGMCVRVEPNSGERDIILNVYFAERPYKCRGTSTF